MVFLLNSSLRGCQVPFCFRIAHHFCSHYNPAFERVVQHICSVINKETEWSLAVEKSLEASVYNFHARLLFRVLKLTKNAHIATGLFHWASRRRNFKHTEFTYCALIEILAHEKDFDQIWSLIYAMHADAIPMSPVPFTTLINSYGYVGLVEDAQKTFEAMPGFNCKPNLHAYNALLNAQMKAQMVSDAFNTLDHMRASGCTPDVVTYTTLITGLCKSHELDKAMHIFNEMKENNCTPNLKTFTAVIQGLLGAGKGSEALSILDDMVANDCCPDAVTYNSLIEWSCKQGDTDKALQLLDQMTSKGCEPNSFTYFYLLDGLFKAGKVHLAYSLVKRMIEHGCNPESKTYMLLADQFCKNANVEETVDILEWIMSRRGNLIAFNHVAVVDCLFKAKRADIVHATVNQMLLKGCQPDRPTCTALINWLCKQGRTDEVVELLEKLSGSNVGTTT